MALEILGFCKTKLNATLILYSKFQHTQSVVLNESIHSVAGLKSQQVQPVKKARLPPQPHTYSIKSGLGFSVPD